MCGLFGYLVAKQPKSEEVYREIQHLIEGLKLYSDSRGGDSWGIVSRPTSRASFRIQKGLGEVFADPGLDYAPLEHTLLGHTRFATVGEKTVANAHPFQYGNVIGSHNGGIWNYKEVARKFHTVYSVDSEALIQSIAEDKKPRGLDGYGAVHWVDTHNGGAYLCRMASGELGARKLEYPDGSVILVWASNLTTILGDMLRPTDKVKPVQHRFTLGEGVVYKVSPEGSLRKTERRIKVNDTRMSHFGDWRTGYACFPNSTGGFGKPDKDAAKLPITLPAEWLGLDYDVEVHPGSPDYEWAKAWLRSGFDSEVSNYELEVKDPVRLSGKDAGTDFDVLFTPSDQDYQAAEVWTKYPREQWGELTWQEFRDSWRGEGDPPTEEASGIDDTTGAIMLPNWSK